MDIISALLSDSQQDAWRQGSVCFQKTQVASSQTLFSYHELQLSQPEIIALHINVPPQKAK